MIGISAIELVLDFNDGSRNLAVRWEREHRTKQDTLTIESPCGEAQLDAQNLQWLIDALQQVQAATQPAKVGA